MNLFHRCYIKQKPSETQRLPGFCNPDGMKLGFTVFLIAYDNMLNLRGIWTTYLSSQFRSTQPTVLNSTKLTPMVWLGRKHPSKSTEPTRYVVENLIEKWKTE